ncbi:MAG: hypothetical protein IM606_00990, partial [Cytophagales bacterium]|nr:hypothetical protein [Cytophagales bacterium]
HLAAGIPNPRQEDNRCPTAQQTYRKSYNPSQIYTRSLDQPTNQTQSAALNRTSQELSQKTEVGMIPTPFALEEVES